MSGQNIAQSIGWLGETWGFWIQTGAFFISALAAVAVIYYNGKQARLRALIDLIVQQKTDASLMQATQFINALHEKGEPWTKHFSPQSAEYHHILMVLNNQEFIAVGVRMGAFDENIYKQMQCSNVLRLWKASSGFIAEVRTQTGIPTLYQDFERLAKRWDKNKIQNLKP